MGSQYSVPVGWYRLSKGTELVAGDQIRKHPFTDEEDSSNLIHYHEIVPCGNAVVDSFCIRKIQPWWKPLLPWVVVIVVVVLCCLVGMGLAKLLIAASTQ